jgi:hypothetical protein
LVSNIQTKLPPPILISSAAGSASSAVFSALGQPPGSTTADLALVGGTIYPSPTEQPLLNGVNIIFDGFLRGLVDRGYARSSWEELDVRLLDPQTALASGITVRYRSDGTLLESVAVTYGLRHSAEGWKIFMSATHAPDSVLRFR